MRIHYEPRNLCPKLTAITFVVILHLLVIISLWGSSKPNVSISSLSIKDRNTGVQSLQAVEFFEVEDYAKLIENKVEDVSVNSEESPDLPPSANNNSNSKESSKVREVSKLRVNEKNPKIIKKKENKTALSHESKVNAKVNSDSISIKGKGLGVSGQGVDSVTSVKHLGGYLNNPKPEYPSRSLDRGEEGTVTLEVVVEPDGHPSDVKVVKSSGYSALDNSALQTVKKYYKFIPATKAGVSIRASYRFNIVFKLP